MARLGPHLLDDAFEAAFEERTKGIITLEIRKAANDGFILRSDTEETIAADMDALMCQVRVIVADALLKR
jgi:sensor histidine kinase regulating citrate/malate metabolism